MGQVPGHLAVLAVLVRGYFGTVARPSRGHGGEQQRIDKYLIKKGVTKLIAGLAIPNAHGGDMG